jgi:concanavalin A-like lectin/glucanase superfamily protein
MKNPITPALRVTKPIAGGPLEDGEALGGVPLMGPGPRSTGPRSRIKMQRPLFLISCLLALGCVNLTRPPELSQPPPVSVDGGLPAEPEPASDAAPPPPTEAGTPEVDAAPAPADAPSPGPNIPPGDARPADAPLAARGAVCTDGMQCQTGFCEDGVCCANLCGRCQACNVAGSVGTCSSVPAGEARPGQCAVEPVAGCGLDGTCDGRGGCRRYTTGTICVPGSCTGATEVGARTCDGAGTCRTASSRSCAPNVCMGGSCATRCMNQSDCQTGFFCDAGTCRAKRAAGEACALGVECGSGNCIEGVCCSSACDQSCFSCNVQGQAGNCVPVPAGQDPRGSCAAEPVMTCGRNGACDGNGNCQRHAPGTECVPADCTGGIALSPRICDGAGNCGGATIVGDCGNFACAGGTCGSTCSMASECQGEATCTNTSCVVPDLALYWKLDETSGTVAQDSSGNGLEGNYAGDSGTPTQSAVIPPPIKFIDGASRAFDSSKRQMIEIANMPSGIKPTAELTLTAWYRSTAIDGGGNGGEVISGGNNYLLRVRPNDLEFNKRVNGQHIRCFATVGNHLDGNWHHLALVVDAAGLKGYFDGVQKCATANTDPMTYDLGNAFRVGRHGQTADTYDFDGNIDEVRVYRRALAQPEIAALAAGGR